MHAVVESHVSKSAKRGAPVGWEGSRSRERFGRCGPPASYAADGEIVKARVMIRNFDPTIPSGFGVPGDYEMDVSMILRDGAMTGTAIVTDHPKYSLGVKLTKKAEV